jgi:squalene-hopene/tetraprenyl-beta-curcumene cyclase
MAARAIDSRPPKQPLPDEEPTMTTRPGTALAAFTGLLSVATVAPADEPVTLENVVAPTANSPDEPLAEFSLERAAHFLDSASLDWQKSRQCFTCHTNYMYLLSRPTISSEAPAHTAIRQSAEQMVTKTWPSEGPRWDAEVVMAALVLAHNDAATTGKLHEATRTTLDRMWTVQREDGGFTWIKCDWPPMESDDEYGACVAALAAGVAPEDYAQSPAAKTGLAKIKEYLAATPMPSLHHRAMLVWAAARLPELISAEERQVTIDELLALQHDDGGWGLASLGNWQRGDGSPQDTAASDGYGTGFVVYVLRQAGLPADDARLQQGIAWLKSNQRDSGRWFTRSLHADSKHFITHAGTAFAVMAIRACEGPAVETQAAAN